MEAYVNTKQSYFLYVGTVWNIKLCILWGEKKKKKVFSLNNNSLQKGNTDKNWGEKNWKQNCLFTDTGLQRLAEHDATVTTQPTTTQAMLTAGSFTQTLVTAAFKSRAILSLTRLHILLLCASLPSLLNLFVPLPLVSRRV